MIGLWERRWVETVALDRQVDVAQIYRALYDPERSLPIRSLVPTGGVGSSAHGNVVVIPGVCLGGQVTVVARHLRLREGLRLEADLGAMPALCSWRAILASWTG